MPSVRATKSTNSPRQHPVAVDPWSEAVSAAPKRGVAAGQLHLRALRTLEHRLQRDSSAG